MTFTSSVRLLQLDVVDYYLIQVDYCVDDALLGVKQRVHTYRFSEK
jgi:hypothetical protein